MMLTRMKMVIIYSYAKAKNVGGLCKSTLGFIRRFVGEERKQEPLFSYVEIAHIEKDLNALTQIE